MTDIDTLLLFGYSIGYGLAVGLIWLFLFEWWRS